MSPLSSPCTKVCAIDPRSGLCLGCGRTLAEIAQWASLGEPERLRIMAQLPEPATLPAWRRPAVVLLWVLGIGALMFSLPGLFEQLFRSAVAVLAGHRLGLADVAMALLLFAGAAAGTLVYAARSE